MSSIHLHQNDHTSTKPTSSSSPSSSAGARPAASDQQQQAAAIVIKCPRCDSPNTKFCYYNNYSLTQPRHFCKTCRRYWTKGGALRNVPIGGGCRKSKKLRSSSSSSSNPIINPSSSSHTTVSSAEIGGGGGAGFKFFHHHHHGGGLNPPPPLPPQMDFNLKDLSLMPSTYNLQSHFSFDGGAGHSVSAAPPLGFTLEPPPPPGAYPAAMMMMRGGGNNGAINGSSMNVNTSLASSIESLSCMNQDLHWKLQQQRLALLFGDNGAKDNIGGPTGMPRQQEEEGDDDGGDQQRMEKPQPILFRDLGEIDRVDAKPELAAAVGGGEKGEGEAATEWFFGNSYGQVVGSGGGGGAAAAGTPSNSSGNSNWNGGSNGVQAWGDLNPYNTTSLP